MTRLLCAVALVSLAGCAARPAAGAKSGESGAQPAAARITNLLTQPLAAEFTAGREVIVDLVEMPPHTTLNRHWHPGEEFHYYLEGQVEIAIDGQKPFLGTPGTVGHVPYKTMHTAITHGQAAKVLVVRVHTAGEPMRYLENDGAERK